MLDFLPQVRLQGFKITGAKSVQLFRRLKQFRIPGVDRGRRVLCTQSRIALTQCTVIALPGIPVGMFHVKQRPIQCLAPVARTAIEDGRGIRAEHLHRESSRQVRQAPDGLPIEVDLQTGRPSLDADRLGPALRLAHPPDQSVGRFAITDRLL